MKSIFSKHYGEKGYSEAEVHEKIRKVNDAHEVGKPTSKWKPATFEPDPRGGWMVVIETI